MSVGTPGGQWFSQTRCTGGGLLIFCFACIAADEDRSNVAARRSMLAGWSFLRLLGAFESPSDWRRNDSLAFGGNRNFLHGRGLRARLRRLPVDPAGQGHSGGRG